MEKFFNPSTTEGSWRATMVVSTIMFFIMGFVPMIEDGQNFFIWLLTVCSLGICLGTALFLLFGILSWIAKKFH